MARAAPRILIIRRGPSRFFHLVLWDTVADTFEHGSWFHGKLFVHRCDLSFDGRWLVYFALGPTRAHWSWTAVSQPPWLRADLFYDSGTGTWDGGGVWVGPNHLWLNVRPDDVGRAGDPRPEDLGFTVEWRPPMEMMTDRGFVAWRLERDGWTAVAEAGQTVKEDLEQGWIERGSDCWMLQPQTDLPPLRLFYRGFHTKHGYVYHYTLDGYAGLVDEAVEWAGYDGQGRLVLARAGVVERYTRDDLERGVPSLRYDLNGLVPPARQQPRPPVREDLSSLSDPDS